MSESYPLGNWNEYVAPMHTHEHSHTYFVQNIEAVKDISSHVQQKM